MQIIVAVRTDPPEDGLPADGFRDGGVDDGTPTTLTNAYGSATRVD